MTYKLSIGHITGSVKATKNYWNSDEAVPRKPRTVGQMFFQPYESREEFIYCARHTFLPSVTIGLAILYPIGMVAIPSFVGGAFFLGLFVSFAVIAGINTLCGNYIQASLALDMMKNIIDYAINDLCQALIDIAVLPISALMMLTRGISTGLSVAGIYGEHEEVPSSLSPVPM